MSSQGTMIKDDLKKKMIINKNINNVLSKREEGSEIIKKYPSI